MSAKEPLVLFLAPWQKRMVKDFMPASSLRGKTIGEITRVVLKWKPGDCNASYKMVMDGIKKGDWLLYLTDEQMVMVREYLKSSVQVPVLNITPEFISNGQVVFR